MAIQYKKIQIRSDVAANFAGVVLTAAEPAFYTDTQQLFIGDGVTAGGIGVAKSGAITGSKLTMNTGKILGRTTAAVGPIEELSKVPIALGGTNIDTYTSGDILYASADNVLSKLPKATNGMVLGLAGGFPAWGTITDIGFANPMTTAGDLIVGGSGGAATRLAVGSNTQILTVTGGVPVWAAPVSSGSVTAAAVGKRIAYYPNATAVVDDADGTEQVIIGTTTTIPVTGTFAIYGTTQATGSYGARVVSDNGAVGPEIYMSKARGGSIGAATATQNTDNLGRIFFGGYGSSQWLEIYTGIKGVARENFTNSAAGGAINFMLTPTGGVSRIDDGFQFYVDASTAFQVSSLNFNFTTGSFSKFTNGTSATSTTSGALQVVGGVGIGGALYIGGNLSIGTGIIADNSLTVGLGAAATYIAVNRGSSSNTGFYRWKTAGTDNWAVGSSATSSNTDLEFYTYGLGGRAMVIAYATGNVTLDKVLVVSGTGVHTFAGYLQPRNIHLTATATYSDYGNMGYDTTNGLHLRGYNTTEGGTSNGGRVTLMSTDNAGNYPALYVYNGISPLVVIPGTTASTSTTTGALVVTGGLGVGGALYAGGPVAIGGDIILSRASGGFELNITSTSQTAPFLRVTSSTGAEAFLQAAGASDVRVGSATSHPVYIQTNSTTRMTLGTTGGINTSATGTMVIGNNAALAGQALALYQITLSGSDQAGLNSAVAFTSSATASIAGVTSTLTTAAAAFTCGTGYGIRIGTPSIGAGSAIANLYGLYIENQTGATTTQFAIYSAGGIWKTTDTTASTSTTTGALVVGGGAGIAGNVYIGGILNAVGTSGHLLKGPLQFWDTGGATQSHIGGIASAAEASSMAFGINDGNLSFGSSYISADQGGGIYIDVRAGVDFLRVIGRAAGVSGGGAVLFSMTSVGVATFSGDTKIAKSTPVFTVESTATNTIGTIKFINTTGAVTTAMITANNNAGNPFTSWDRLGTLGAAEFIKMDATPRIVMGVVGGIVVTIVATGITVAGSVTTAAPSGGTAAAWKMGAVAAVSPTAPNRTIELDVGGTRYFLAAKTTND